MLRSDEDKKCSPFRNSLCYHISRIRFSGILLLVLSFPYVAKLLRCCRNVPRD